jgi:hypothetical protein
MLLQLFPLDYPKVIVSFLMISMLGHSGDLGEPLSGRGASMSWNAKIAV